MARYTHTHTPTPTPTPLHPYTPTPLHPYTPTPLHPYTLTQLHTYTPTHLHTYTPTHLHTCTPAHLHTCTPAHLHTCTPTHLHQRQVHLSTLHRAQNPFDFWALPALASTAAFVRACSSALELSLIFGVSEACVQTPRPPHTSRIQSRRSDSPPPPVLLGYFLNTLT